MTTAPKRSDAELPDDVEAAPEPPMSADEKRAFLASLKRAEEEIARGDYTVLNPTTFLEELKKKLFPDSSIGPK